MREILNIIKSVSAAMIGVQSKKNLEADLSKKSIIPFIIVAIIMTIIFVLTLISIIKLVLN